VRHDRQPTNLLQQDSGQGQWQVMDRAKKIALIKLTAMRSGRKD
jgi:hypothetical protein